LVHHPTGCAAPCDPRQETDVPFVLLVLIVAVAASRLRGGRVANLAQASLSRPWLLFLAVALQVAVDLGTSSGFLGDASGTGWALLVTSQLVVLGFVVANRHLPGMALVALGLAFNAVVMAANGAMPVDPEAIRALGMEDPELIPGKHTLLGEHTLLPWLADIIPVRPLRSIISVGDVVLGLGLVPLTHALMLRPPAGPPAVTRRRPTGDARRPG